MGSYVVFLTNGVHGFAEAMEEGGVGLWRRNRGAGGGYEGFLGEGEDKGMIRGNRFEEIRCSLFSSPRPPLQQVNRNCKAKLRRATKHDHVNNTAPNTTANSRDGG